MHSVLPHGFQVVREVLQIIRFLPQHSRPLDSPTTTTTTTTTTVRTFIIIIIIIIIITTSQTRDRGGRSTSITRIAVRCRRWGWRWRRGYINDDVGDDAHAMMTNATTTTTTTTNATTITTTTDTITIITTTTNPTAAAPIAVRVEPQVPSAAKAVDAGHR